MSPVLSIANAFIEYGVENIKLLNFVEQKDGNYILYVVLK